MSKSIVEENAKVYALDTLGVSPQVKRQLLRLEVEACLEAMERKLTSSSSKPWAKACIFHGSDGSSQKLQAARALGRTLQEIGLLSCDDLHVVGLSDITGKTIGESQLLVLSVLEKATGGTLFLDLSTPPVTAQEKWALIELETYMYSFIRNFNLLLVIACGKNVNCQAIQQTFIDICWSVVDFKGSL